MMPPLAAGTAEEGCLAAEMANGLLSAAGAASHSSFPIWKPNRRLFGAAAAADGEHAQRAGDIADMCRHEEAAGGETFL